jgi:hypothetical protein
MENDFFYSVVFGNPENSALLVAGINFSGEILFVVS